MTGKTDDWEQWRFGVLIYDANDDPDGDGSPNYAEFAADTDPSNAASAFRINTLSVDSGAATMAFAPAPNRTCFIEQSPDLKNWTLIPAGVRTNAPAASVTLTNLLSDKAFLRLVVP